MYKARIDLSFIIFSREPGIGIQQNILNFTDYTDAGSAHTIIKYLMTRLSI